MASIKIALSGGKHLYLLGIYRPPGSVLEEALTRISTALEMFPSNNTPICMVGDLNVDSLNTSKEKENRALNNILASFDMHRANLPPTRVTSTSESSIDVVCSNLNPRNFSIKVIHEHISDHSGQLCTLDIPAKTKTEPILTRRQVSDQNLSQLKTLLAEESWVNVYQTADVSESLSNLVRTLTLALDASCPYKKSRSKRPRLRSFQYDPDVDVLKASFLQAQNRFLLTGRECDKLEANRRKKSYDLKLKSSRRAASEKVISESSNKTKAIWSIVNSERRACAEPREITWKLNVSNKVVEDPKMVADCFNEYFTSIAGETLKANTSQRTTLPIQLLQPATDYGLVSFHPTTTDEVRCIIRSLKPTPSTGVDDISSRLLKFCEGELCPPLADIINKSLAQAIFPGSMKIAKVYPLHKKGKN
ncbi:uncharacterized protein LOC124355939 [Homalodisca vitripennis]|uniref:uncharacterized protein LOC124355939 n=1 Tax=Homalodisca vitripennis TaxID=197043 RepID=UPI001EE9CB73|nr:uncharacterized protein LOC124355939 [Homalodisca vitripennis]